MKAWRRYLALRSSQRIALARPKLPTPEAVAAVQGSEAGSVADEPWTLQANMERVAEKLWLEQHGSLVPMWALDHLAMVNDSLKYLHDQVGGLGLHEDSGMEDIYPAMRLCNEVRDEDRKILKLVAEVDKMRAQERANNTVFLAALE